MSFNYLTIGYDCSPAGALRNLKIRDFALPFDWVISNVNALEKCFESNFENFHKNLVFNSNKTKLIDYYGFQFPHDYPLSYMSNVDNDIGEGLFGEENGKFITDKWYEYYDIVLDKYHRRIERFKNILNNTKPIIVLSRYNKTEILKIQTLFMKYYNIQNIYFINASEEVFENDKILFIHTEKNNIWNDVNIWKQGIDYIIDKINSDQKC